MTYNTTKSNNSHKKEFLEQRKQWHIHKETLSKNKNALGYKNTPLKHFADKDFIAQEVAFSDQPKASAILEIHNQLKDLEEKYKVLWPEEWIVREFNKKHAIVHIDQTYVLTEKQNTLGNQDFSLESRNSFRTFYEDTMSMNEQGKMKSHADIWLKNPKRRKFTNITFDPTQPDHIGASYNIWKGFAKEPRKGNTEKYWAHVRDNICSGNQEHYHYVRKWLAYIFQYPDVVHTALVLCGSQGVGKNSFAEPLGILFGQHYVLLSSITELVSNFNYHLKNAVLIHANEALWGGNKKELGAVKAMITEQTCLIESKGKDRIMVKNFKHIILSSNEDWPVHIDADDRRFFVLRVSEQHKEDHAYFATIQTELNNGGYEALLYDLLHEDVTDFNPRKLPHSDEAFAIKLRSSDSATRYIYEALCQGGFNLAGENYHDWRTMVANKEIYEDYQEWCHQEEEKSITKSQFFKTLNKYIPSATSTRPSNKGHRPYSYEFPSLDQARDDFCKAFKTDYQYIFGSKDDAIAMDNS